MAIAIPDVLDTQISTGNTLVFDSVSVTAGDLLIACVATTAITPPTAASFSDDASNSWNNTIAPQSLTTDFAVVTGVLKVGYIIAPSTDAGLIVTCTPNQNNLLAAGVLLRTTGHHATTPISASPAPASAQSAGASTTTAVTLGSTPASTSAGISFCVFQNLSGIAPASGYTELAEVPNDGAADLNLEASYNLLDVTTTGGGQVGSNGPWGVITLVIDVAAAGGGGGLPKKFALSRARRR